MVFWTEKSKAFVKKYRGSILSRRRAKGTICRP